MQTNAIILATRYKMLLEQLLKLTPPDHVEIHELQAATLACLYPL